MSRRGYFSRLTTHDSLLTTRHSRLTILKISQIQKIPVQAVWIFYIPASDYKTDFMNALAITIVHPAYENLKRMGRFLHFAAAILILFNALHLLQQPKLNHLYFWCQLIIGIDILIVVFTNRNLVQDLPRINTIFRFIECIIFLGAAAILLTETNWIMGSVLVLVSGAYGYLLYCEQKISTVEMVKFNHIGITISGIPQSSFFLWSRINGIDIRYDSVSIKTSENKICYFPLRQNLQFEELDQIHEFCRHYLKQAVSL